MKSFSLFKEKRKDFYTDGVDINPNPRIKKNFYTSELVY